MPKGIFRLLVVANVEYLTKPAPLFQSQKPSPVGIMAKYKIENICILVK